MEGLRLLAIFLAGPLLAQDHSRWADYGGAPDAAQYSSLKQIDRSNVHRLKVAWSFLTGDDARYFFNPLIAGDRMFVLANANSIVCLDAASGREIWRYSPGADTKIITNRGINYWESRDGKESRLLFASNHRLRAIDARTGKAIPSFGDGGSVT